MDPLEVTPQRADAAARIVSEKILQLNDPELTALMVASELNFYDDCRYDADGMLQFDLTDLQMVAFAAALTAVAECGGYFSPVPLERNRVQVQKVEYTARNNVTS